MPEALALRNVTAGYGETHVLESIDLALAEGESLSVIGRNGVGKSTLLETIMGHTTLHAGEIALGARRMDRAPAHERALAGLGYVPQEREIFPSLSVRENLELCARPGHWTSQRVFELFPNLKDRLDAPGTQLSGGEQQGKRGVPSSGDCEREHQRARGADLQRGEMQHRKRRAEAQQPLQPMDEHRGSEGAAAARLQDDDQAGKDDWIGREQAGERRTERAPSEGGRDYDRCNE